MTEEEKFIEAKRLYETANADQKYVLETLFPELKESEGERIRKAIVTYLKSTLANKKYGDKVIESWIAWLEKQGELKSIEPDTLIQQRVDALADIVAEQKTVDKVEPKFHEGDWVVVSTAKGDRVVQISSSVECFKNGYPIYITTGGRWFGNETKARLWTIEDAKDGDVLATEPIKENYQCSFVAIYKERGLGFFNSYCFIGFDGKFYEADTGHSIEKIHPATKEQRDTLMKAMTDAGYTFDFEKKELKKQWNISDYKTWQYIVSDVLTKHDGIGQYLDDGLCKKIAKYMQEEWSKKLCLIQHTAWNEEDSVRLQRIIDFLWKNRKGDTDTIYQQEQDVDWLKSLKDKVQPKQEWSEEDENNALFIVAALDAYYRVRKDNNNENGQEKLEKAVNWIHNRLKSIKPQNTWRPSDEQMKEFSGLLDEINWEGAILVSPI